MTPPSDEYCPLKSGLSLLLRSSLTWVLASFVLGVLLMSAVGKGNDLEKAMWFATGAAITAVATAYQTYQSNKRAADERVFTEEQARLNREHEIVKATNEHTITMRMSAYEKFIEACTSAIDSEFDKESRLGIITTASSKVGIIGTDAIYFKCLLASRLANNITQKMSEDKKNTEINKLMNEFSDLAGEISCMMRDDIGRGNVCLTRSANQKK